MYQWFVFIHLVGVFGFLVAHGVSAGVALRVRTERDPARVNALLDLSSQALTPFYISFVILLAGGITATFLGELWGQAWIWASIAILVVVTVAMFAMATTYFRRVRFITRAMTEGTEAVTEEQYVSVLRSGRPVTIAVIGFAGLALILFLMLFKPSLGFGASEATQPAPRGPSVEIAADEVAFDTKVLDVPAEEPFSIVFENRGAGVPHNVAIYEDESAARELFVGDVFTGGATITYRVDALPEGEHFFRCDVHPTTMTGTVEAVFTLTPDEQESP